MITRLAPIALAMAFLSACESIEPEPTSTVLERGEWGLTDDYDYTVSKFSEPYSIRGIEADFKVFVSIKSVSMEELQQDLENLKNGNVKVDADYDSDERKKTFIRACKTINQTYSTLKLVDGEGAKYTLFIECT